MKLGVFAKNSILLLILFTIVVGGIFFDAHESLALSDQFGYDASTEESEASRPLNAKQSWANMRPISVVVKEMVLYAVFLVGDQGAEVDVFSALEDVCLNVGVILF